MSRAALLRRLAELVAAGEPCASAQIVKAQGSIPNEVGAFMVIGADGALVGGTVGGGQIEADVLAEARAALAEGRSRLMTSKLTESAAGGIGMLCGGSVKVFIEVHIPAPRLVLLGAGHVNRALARMADGLGFRILVIDERPEWANEANYPNAELLLTRPEVGLGDVGVTARDFIVVGTPGHDHVALAAAARTPARYIGVVASKRKAHQVTEQVAAEGVDLAALLPRLYAPIGLDLGGRSPESVALSILAQLQAVRHGRDGAPLRLPPEQLQCYIVETAPR